MNWTAPLAEVADAVERRDELRIDRQAIDSVILIEGGRWYKESDAALRTAATLAAPGRR